MTQLGMIDLVSLCQRLVRRNIVIRIPWASETEACTRLEGTTICIDKYGGCFVHPRSGKDTTITGELLHYLNTIHEEIQNAH